MKREQMLERSQSLYFPTCNVPYCECATDSKLSFHLEFIEVTRLQLLKLHLTNWYVFEIL